MLKEFHPLTLIVVALLLSSLAIGLSSLAGLTGVLLLAVLLRGGLTGVQMKAWLRELRILLPMFLAVLLVQALLNRSGIVLWDGGWLVVYTGGLRQGAAFCLRLLILLNSARFLLKLSYDDFDLAFHTLRFPEELGFMVFYALHVIPLAGEQIRHSMDLLRMRGINLGRSKWHAKLLIFRLIALSLLAQTLSRSAQQATALELRGFRSSGTRTRLLKYRFGLADFGLLLGMTVSAIVVITYGN